MLARHFLCLVRKKFTVTIAGDTTGRNWEEGGWGLCHVAPGSLPTGVADMTCTGSIPGGSFCFE